jgi:transmembrane sensor
MNPKEGPGDGVVTSELMAEAAAWLAILHGPQRNPATERGFAQWLKKSIRHQRAFEEATDIWLEASSLPRTHLGRTRSVDNAPSRVRSRPRLLAALAVSLGLGLIGAVAYLYFRNLGIATGIGEQRVLVLEDGSRAILNTRTRVVVDYTQTTRKVILKEGEAVFEVMKNPQRPFVVDAGDREVIALGTSFSVRRDGNQVSVTLVEGKISISATDTPVIAPPHPEVFVLKPGERLRFVTDGAPTLDNPPIERLLAWERREVAFDDTALDDAIREMNRYNRKPLVASLSQARSLRVTGLFRAGDSMSFARAVAEAYHLSVQETAAQFRLTDSNATHGISFQRTDSAATDTPQRP